MSIPSAGKSSNSSSSSRTAVGFCSFVGVLSVAGALAAVDIVGGLEDEV